MTSAPTVIRRTPTRSGRIEAAEWLIWLTVLLLLGAGLLGAESGRGAPGDLRPRGGLTLQYPADWQLLADKEAFQVFHAVDPTSSVQFPTSVRVRRIPLGELGRAASSLGDVALSWSTRQGQRDSDLQCPADRADKRERPAGSCSRLRLCCSSRRWALRQAACRRSFGPRTSC